MRRYDDRVEVRRGQVTGPGGLPTEGPELFLWHGSLWKIRLVLARWTETGAWWHSAGVAAVTGTDSPSSPAGHTGSVSAAGLLGERELWRVEAGRGRIDAERPAHHDHCETAGPDHGGVFDLSYDSSDGLWQLVGCLD